MSKSECQHITIVQNGVNYIINQRTRLLHSQTLQTMTTRRKSFELYSVSEIYTILYSCLFEDLHFDDFSCYQGFVILNICTDRMWLDVRLGHLNIDNHIPGHVNNFST